jgi:molybdenum cofactor synthesis domain-containing protein
MGTGKGLEMRPFKELIGREEAMERILGNVEQIKRVEEVKLDESDGRVLAEDIDARFDVPPFDRSAMDGYALHASDTLNASEETPIVLRIIGKQHTGDLFEETIGLGECVVISTGAPIPNGADAVVMVEYTETEGNLVNVFKEVKPGRNIAPAGEDMKKGNRLLDVGEYITPGKVGTLAALGYEKVKVYERPHIGVYSSGPEIVPQNHELGPGQIYDINSFTLSSVIKRNGGVPLRMGVIPDDYESIKESILDASKFDLVVLSGGSSVGSKDLFADVIQEIGEIVFHGVSVKPGKPTLFGKVDGTPIFGMPGYPTSCLNNSYVFLTPALRKIAGLPPVNRRKITVPMGHRMESKSDREHFITVRVSEGKAFMVYKQSGDITSMTHADGFMILPIGKSIIKESETVQVTLFDD